MFRRLCTGRAAATHGDAAASTAAEVWSSPLLRTVWRLTSYPSFTALTTCTLRAATAVTARPVASSAAAAARSLSTAASPPAATTTAAADPAHSAYRSLEAGGRDTL